MGWAGMAQKACAVAARGAHPDRSCGMFNGTRRLSTTDTGPAWPPHSGGRCWRSGSGPQSPFPARRRPWPSPGAAAALRGPRATGCGRRAGSARGVAEYPQHVEPAEAGGLGQVFQRDLVRQPFGKVGAHPAHGGVAVAGGHGFGPHPAVAGQHQRERAHHGRLTGQQFRAFGHQVAETQKGAQHVGIGHDKPAKVGRASIASAQFHGHAVQPARVCVEHAVGGGHAVFRFAAVDFARIEQADLPAHHHGVAPGTAMAVVGPFFHQAHGVLVVGVFGEGVRAAEHPVGFQAVHVVAAPVTHVFEGLSHAGVRGRAGCLVVSGGGGGLSCPCSWERGSPACRWSLPGFASGVLQEIAVGVGWGSACVGLV